MPADPQTYNGKVYVTQFISDNDASTRSVLQNIGEDTNGGLFTEILELTFLCDINHHIKVMAKPLFALAALSNRLSIYTKINSLGVKRNIGWYLRGYRNNKIRYSKISLQT